MFTDLNQQSTNLVKADKIAWLADQIFKSFPGDVTGLIFYVLDCGCIYYQRKFRDGHVDPNFGIYRDAKNGPCGKCMVMDETWKDRMITETTVYNSKFQVG